MQRTTIAVSPHVRDRLQTYGRKGMSYEEILVSLMDLADPTTLDGRFEPTHHSHPMTSEEARRWRETDPTTKLELGERMRRMAIEANPKGYRSVSESKKKRNR